MRKERTFASCLTIASVWFAIACPDAAAQALPAVDPLCTPVPVAGVETTLYLDAVTGHFTVPPNEAAAPSRLPQGSIAVTVTNQNPFVFTHALDVSSQPVGVAPIAAVVGALAQAAGLPAGIVSAVVGPRFVPPSSDEWTLDPACPAAQRNQAQQFLDYLQRRGLEYEEQVTAAQTLDADFDTKVLQPLRTADALRKALVVPTAACVDVVRSARQLVADSGAPLNGAAEHVASATNVLARLAILAPRIKAEIAFYETAFDNACMVPGVQRLASSLTYNVAEATKRYAAAAASVADLKSASAATDIVLKTTPSPFMQTRVHHPGDNPARLTVRLRRLANAEKGEGTLVAERRFDMGDTQRFTVSVGLFGGQFGKKGGDLVRYQPVLAPNPAAGQPVEPGKPAPAPTITVVGVERQGRSYALPAGLAHFRPWKTGPYLSAGGGPSGEGGAYALSYIVGGSFITNRRVVWTVGAISGVSQALPPGLTLEPPSELPAGTTSIATEKDRRWGWLAGVSFAIW